MSLWKKKIQEKSTGLYWVTWVS